MIVWECVFQLEQNFGNYKPTPLLQFLKSKFQKSFSKPDLKLKNNIFMVKYNEKCLLHA